MIEHAFTKKNIARVIAHKDFSADPSLIEDAERNALVANAIRQIEKDTVFHPSLINLKIAGKIAYTFATIEQELVTRLISKNLRSNYNIRSQNRHTIIRNTLSFLKEGSPYRLYRYDIVNFFENIDREAIIKKLLNEEKCPRHTIVLLDKFFKALSLQNIAGLPRGLGISSILAELQLLEFDRHLKNSSDIFFYSRFVDDILIIAPHNFSQSDMYAMVTAQLAPLEVHKVGDKAASIHIAKMHYGVPSSVSFDYLGYRFNISDNPSHYDTVMGIPRRKIDIDISDSKILKIKNRLIDSFTVYLKSKSTPEDYALLKNRIKALTGNYYITDPISGIPIKTGIFFNYSQKNTPTPCSLSNLDALLRGLLYSKKHKLSVRIANKIKATQKIELIGYSFTKGFNNQVFHSFTHPQLNAVKKGWHR